MQNHSPLTTTQNVNVLTAAKTQKPNITEIPPAHPGGVVWRIHWDRITDGARIITVDKNGEVWAWSKACSTYNKTNNCWYAYGGTRAGGEPLFFNIGPREDFWKLKFKLP